MTEFFVKLPQRVLCRSDLTPLAKLVFAAICDHMRTGRRAWPGVRRICSLVGVTDKPVMRSIRELENRGLLNVSRPGRGRHNTYSLVGKTESESAPGGQLPLCRRYPSRGCGTLSTVWEAYVVSFILSRQDWI